MHTTRPASGWPEGRPAQKATPTPVALGFASPAEGVGQDDHRWQRLVEALVTVSAEPTATARLGRIAVVAADVTRARYAALVLHGPQGVAERLVLSESDLAGVDAVRRRLARHHLELSGALGGDAVDADGCSYGHTTPELDLLDAPVCTDGGLVGNLYVLGCRVPGGFTLQDLCLLNRLAECTAVGLGSARQHS